MANVEPEKHVLSSKGISVIISVNDYNSKQLEHVLSNFLQINTHFPFELIIADQTSGKQTRKIIEKYVTKAFIRYIRLSQAPEKDLSPGSFSPIHLITRKSSYIKQLLLHSTPLPSEAELTEALNTLTNPENKTNQIVLNKTAEAYSGKNNENEIAKANKKSTSITIPKISDHVLFTKRAPTADIIVCVHNALADVKQCLNSLLYKTSHPYRIILVNDGSDQESTEYLKEFASDHPGTVLIHNKTAQGYTKAANQGLKASSADYNILLNSDTIVTYQWLERIIECGESDSNIGIIGPLSNAASYQSVPKLREENNDWAVNPLPEGISPDHVAQAVYTVTKKRFPQAPFINGFCYTIKKQVIENIGFFDEDNFPMGYGEENDYSIRARQAGFSLSIADHAYVYHHKSKSFSHEKRKTLASTGRKALDAKHGKHVIPNDIKQWEKNDAIEEIRPKLLTLMSNKATLEQLLPATKPKLLWLLNGPGGGGGALSIVQEANCLRELGWTSHVAVHQKFKKKLVANYAHLSGSVFLFYKSSEELFEIATNYNVVIGTHFPTIKTLEKLYQKNRHIIPAYYVQDYEPWIIDPTEKNYEALVKEAFLSYTRIPSMVCFAKTEWIVKTVKKFHSDVCINKVTPGLDTSVFAPDKMTVKKVSSKLRIASMIRPSTPRRSPEKTMKVLKSMKKKHPQKVEIVLFGCLNSDQRFLAMPRDFEYKNEGILTATEVSELLTESDIFLDMSVYQAFGRTGLEAMAKGCAAVLPVKGGVQEYADNGVNCLLVNTDNQKEVENALEKLVFNQSLRYNLAENAVITASRYSVTTAALSEAHIFQSKANYLKKHNPISVNDFDYRVNLAKKILFHFFKYILPKIRKENHKEMIAYWDWKSKTEGWFPKVMVGTLYSGENEITACKISIKNQDYPYVEHIIFEGLPKKEAMSTLYEYFLKSEYDLLVKIDADMVVLDSAFISKIVNIYRVCEDISLIQMAIYDYYSGGPIQGVNAYSKKMNWEKSVQHELFTDKTTVPKQNRLIIWTKFIDSVIHAPQTSAFHSFHFGIHRGLKAVLALEESNDIKRSEEQVIYLAKTWQHYCLRKENNLLMACLGAELSFRKAYQIYHLDYTNPKLLKDFKKYSKQSFEKIEEQVHELMSEKIQNIELQKLREKHYQHREADTKVKSILFIIPHMKVFGGINRFFELSHSIQKLGYNCTISIPDAHIAPYKIQENYHPSYSNPNVISLSEALKKSWDVVVCGDYSHGVMPLLSLFKCGLSVAYLLNGWQHRIFNISQIKLINPDIVIANSSYSATHYPELAPNTVAGGVNTGTFSPKYPCINNLNSSHIKIFIPGATNKPRKRVTDAIEACTILNDRGYAVKVLAVTTSNLECNTNYPVKVYTNISGKEISELLSTSDIVLCPEEDAGWNNPAAEALACQRPLVCTPAGTTDFAFHGQTAMVVEPKNPTAMADAVQYLIEHPYKAQQIAKTGFEKIQEFSWDNVARSFLEVINHARIDYSARRDKNTKAIKKISKSYWLDFGGNYDN